MTGDQRDRKLYQKLVDESVIEITEKLARYPDLLFHQLTPVHKRYLVSFMFNNRFTRSNINKAVSEIKRHSEHDVLCWLGRRNYCSNAMKINDLTELLISPLPMQTTGVKVVKDSLSILLSYGITKNCIKPTAYPWDDLDGETYFKAGEPNLTSWNEREIRNYYRQLDLEVKAYASIHIDDLRNDQGLLWGNDGKFNHLDLAEIWESYLTKPAAVQTVPDIPSNPTTTPDGLPIPWLMTETKRKRQITRQIIEAAYRLYRQKHGRNHDRPEQLFELINPQDMPEFVRRRNDSKVKNSVSIELVNGKQWSYKKYLGVYRLCISH